MPEQFDSFSDGYTPDEGVLRADELDFAAIVEDVQSDGVGHTKMEVSQAIVRGVMDLNKHGVYPLWQQKGTAAFVDKGLNGAYSIRDKQGLLVYPAINSTHERKAEDFMTCEEYQYVITGLLDQSKSLRQQATIWTDRRAMRFPDAV